MSAADALVLAARKPGITADDFVRQMAQLRPGIGALAILLPAEALPALAHTDALDPALPDALVTIPHAQAADFVRAAEALIDFDRTSLLAFERHAILPGHNAIRLFFGLRRLGRLSHAAFCDYWLNHHAELGRRLIPPFTYHQLHGDPQATAALAKEAGLAASSLDGVVEVHFPDVAALIRQLSRAEVAEEALADEKNFIDHARSLFWAYQEVDA